MLAISIQKIQYCQGAPCQGISTLVSLKFVVSFENSPTRYHLQTMLLLFVVIDVISRSLTLERDWTARCSVCCTAEDVLQLETVTVPR